VQEHVHPQTEEARGSVVKHAEMMRRYLEDLLGQTTFLEVYQRMNEMYEHESYDAQELCSIVAPDKLYCVQMLQQLVLLENNLQAGVGTVM
jgi:hypothetical protein